ncbi:hypothetical protein [Longimicrobium sp.]|uniref:hypothetical protein n=1 Tax=Longimicrobium sp. TaxID=2029185 RepID=UPI002E2FBD6B|nr:hypothetical protein [Longimicrobium sp.]HEX6040564.1 hypothetical protein [Longimicrobium sp.]
MKATLLAVAALAAFTPLRLPLVHSGEARGAECTTCCPLAGAKCIVCSTTCMVVEQAYDNGGGKCIVPQS